MGGGSPPESVSTDEVALALQPDGAPIAKHGVRFRTEFDDRVKPLYPKRQGDQRWEAAISHFRAARKGGEPLESIVNGVLRYAAYCQNKGWVGTELVKQARTFFGSEKCWREEWALGPVTPAGRPRRGSDFGRDDSGFVGG